jgi:hypothetical protein
LRAAVTAAERPPAVVGSLSLSLSVAAAAVRLGVVGPLVLGSVAVVEVEVDVAATLPLGEETGGGRLG